MAPPGFILLANRGTLTKATLYPRIRQRLQQEPGCSAVRVHPSRARPRRIDARVTPETFLGSAYAEDEATLEIEFSYPADVDHEYYRIAWSESARNLAVGWHQDEGHPDLGRCHFQIDHDGATVTRKHAEFVDDHPLEVLETRLEHLRDVLLRLTWSDGHPELPA